MQINFKPPKIVLLTVLTIAAVVIIAVVFYIFWVGFHLPSFIIGDNDQSGKTPEGFIVSVFAKDLKDPRVIAFDTEGRMLVSETAEGKVLVLEDKNKDGAADEKRVVLEGLNKPHGLAFYTDPKTKTVYLYVAETNQAVRYIYDEKSGAILEQNKTGQNIANLPADGRHFTRTIAFGPNYRKEQIIKGGGIDTLADTKLYISVGSSCDVCVEDTWKRAAILESDPEGNYLAEFAGGLRNSVFFTFNSETKEMWATEMGRDNLGDDLPPDEVNIIKVADEDDPYGAKRYGWPFCYGNQIKDANFNPGKYSRTDLFEDCSKTVIPVIEIPAHSAPLGLAFIKSDKFPADWQGNLVIAFHGSWNRSELTGYKIARYKKNSQGRYQYVGDLVNWLEDGKGTGRPVDFKFSSEGALYVSDDMAGKIYKIEYVQ